MFLYNIEDIIKMKVSDKMFELEELLQQIKIFENKLKELSESL